jgi:hypothetical protein
MYQAEDRIKPGGEELLFRGIEAGWNAHLGLRREPDRHNLRNRRYHNFARQGLSSGWERTGCRRMIFRRRSQKITLGEKLPWSHTAEDRRL